MRTISIAALLLLAGTACVHRGEEAIPAEEEYNEPLPAAPNQLLQGAEEQLTKGDLTRAHAQADRVYRMQPQNYRVLFLLARIARQNQSPADAEQWAYKTLEALHPQNIGEQRRVWEFIASCREAQGDGPGAAEALREAQKLRRD